jgi:8-oxo-dGTP pyrophosphatase MutT (NUDIX family)
MPAARAIRLRRPPVLVRVDGRFVPQGVALDEVDAAWKTLCARNPRYFDGPVLQVLGVSRNGHGGVQIHVQESSYRFVAVAALGIDCGARPIGVKGFVRDGDRVLMGRRSRSVASYPGAWEFVPGGTLEPGEAPEAAVVRELSEEAQLDALSPPVAVAVLFDTTASSWEIVFRIAARLDALPEVGGDYARWEYDEFRAVDRAGAESFVELSACARQIMQFAFDRT